MTIKLILLMVLIACALHDLFCLKVPNVLTASLVVLFAASAVMQDLAVESVVGHTLVGLIVFIFGAILFRFRLIGGGDVKLLAATCLWAGPSITVPHMVVTSLLALGLLVMLQFARWLYPAILIAVPRMSGLPRLPVLEPGAGTPYGVAIVASAILLGIPRSM